MCTVTYFPLAEGFILTSNRDERISRSDTLPPAAYPAGTETFYYPRDQESSGTWIAASSSGKTFCLLNGGFETHKSEPPYRKSRGLILLEMLQHSDPEVFIHEGGLKGIEPFTLIMLQNKDGNTEIMELRWEGARHYLRKKEAMLAHIWSSATLYDADIRQAREQWFQVWLRQNQQPGRKELLDFHPFGGGGDIENNLIMKRSNDRQTISITSVIYARTEFSMHYLDLVQQTESQTEIR